MAWSTPLTAASNTPLTAAQWNASVRDNLLTTPAALASTSSQMWVSTGANSGAIRTPSFAHVTASQSTTTVATFGDLTTVGPVVTVTTGTNAIVSIAAFVSNSTASGGGYMAYAVSGATTVAADTTRCIRVISATNGETERVGISHFHPGLSSGSNTFTAKYTTTTGSTASFQERHLIVFPL